MREIAEFCFIAGVVLLQFVSPVAYVNLSLRMCEHQYFGSIAVGRWTWDGEVVGSTPGRVAVKWLLLGWVTVCGQLNHLSM